MTRENYSLLWRRAVAKNPIVQIPTDPTPDPDNLATWPNSGTFQTEEIPTSTGVSDPDPDQEEGQAPPEPDVIKLVFEVTRALPTAARNDANGLRFTGPGGVHLGHLRTITNRIFVAGQFTVGQRIQITYYWGKTGQSQPGVGFPSAATILSDFRLFLLFENNAPRDYSADPVQWTTVGTPTFAAGRNGQLMICGPGNRIETTAAKLRSNARDQRHAMALIRTPDGVSSGRIICWADWSINQRAFQLFSQTDYVELYVDEDGVSPYQRWANRSPFLSGYSMIGCSWIAGQIDAIVQRDRNAAWSAREFDTPVQGLLHNSTSPYIIGGTPVADMANNSDIEAVLELKSPLSPNQMAAYDTAWRENEAFLGFDRTPDAVTIPSLSNQERSTEVVFAKIQIKGMSAGTAISISGNGNPSYAVSSSATATDDVLSKRNTAGTIDAGQWVRVWHTTNSAYATPQVSNLTIGTRTITFQSTTKAAAGTGGGTAIPTGPATYTVTSLAALKNVWSNQLQPGQILEIAAGDYKSEGGFILPGKDFSGGAPPVVRASPRAYRGQLPSEGGTLVANDRKFRSGSGGAEFYGVKLNGIRNVVFDGIRTFSGDPGSSAGRMSWYGGEMQNSQDLQFHYCKFTGADTDPKASYSILSTTRDPEYPWDCTFRGIAVGHLQRCERIKFKKCLFTNFGYMQLFLANVGYAVVEDCAFMNNRGDHLMTSGQQTGLIVKRCVFFQGFCQRGAGGGMPHLDIMQNTAQDQDCAVNHTYELILSGPGESNYAHWQGPFLEADKYPTFREALGLVIKDSVFEHRSTNTIYVRPANGVLVDRVTTIQNQWGGWFLDSSGNRRQGDSLMHNPLIVWNAKTANGKSFGNNKVQNSIFQGVDQTTGDQIINSTTLPSSGFPTHLYDYPLFTGTVAEGHPNYRPVKFLNEYGAINPTELRRMAPKFSSSLHPDKKGGHYGGSALFELYGALPTS